MPVTAALARLEREIASVGQLGEEIAQVSRDLESRNSELQNLKAEKGRLDEKVRTASLQNQTATTSHDNLLAQFNQLEDQNRSLQREIATQESSLADRRARLQSLANEAARLHASTRRVTQDYNSANYGLTQVLAFVGAASLGNAENFQMLRTAMSKSHIFHLILLNFLVNFFRIQFLNSRVTLDYFYSSFRDIFYSF